MTLRRFALPFAASLFGLALFVGAAHADVAPPPDAGKIVDMATTQAQPDMTVVKPAEDDGCSMSLHHSSTGGSLLFVGGVAGLLFASRRRRA